MMCDVCNNEINDDDHTDGLCKNTYALLEVRDRLDKLIELLEKNTKEDDMRKRITKTKRDQFFNRRKKNE